jgi:hypothetical protein
MGNGKYFDIKHLLPFHTPGKGVPRSVSGEEEKIAKLDPDLNPEELSYIRHYLGYADILLDAQPDELPGASTEEETREKQVIEMHDQIEAPNQAQSTKHNEDGDKEAA